MHKLILLLFLMHFIYTEKYTLKRENNKLVFKLISYDKIKILYKNSSYDKFIIDSFVNIDNPNFPDLPIIRKPLLGSNLKIKLRPYRFKIINTEKIISIKKPNKRCEKVTSDYSFDDMYSEDMYYPEEIISLKKFHNEKLINNYILEINPFLYNPVKNLLKIITFLELELSDKVSSFDITLPMHQLYEILFLNFKNYKFNIVEHDALIITSDKYYKEALTLYNHKIAMNNRNIRIKKTSEITNIKKYIKKMYETKNTKYVILIGNTKDIPILYSHSIYTHSDSLYGIFDGNINNVFISRITGNNNLDIINQINKIIRYEKPSTIHNLNYLGIASKDGEPNDCHFMKRLHKMINDSTASFESFKFNIICDHEGTKEDLIRYVNKGTNFINYLGHGSGIDWTTTGYNITDNKYLHSPVNPIIIDVSCLNGNIKLNPCLAESLSTSFLSGTGSLAMYSSIPLADWFPPLYMQYFSYHVLQFTRGITSVGQMAYSGTMMACVMYPNNCHNMAHGFILYGDSSMEVYTL